MLPEIHMVWLSITMCVCCYEYVRKGSGLKAQSVWVWVSEAASDPSVRGRWMTNVHVCLSELACIAQIYLRVTSLEVWISVYSCLVMQVLTWTPSATFPSPALCTTCSPSPEKNWNSTTLLHCAANLSIPPLSLSHPVGGTWVGVPVWAQLLETVGFMMHQRTSLLETGFKEHRASLKGKDKTPSSVLHAAFLPYKALKYTNTGLLLHSAHWSPTLACATSWGFCPYMIEATNSWNWFYWSF